MEQNKNTTEYFSRELRIHRKVETRIFTFYFLRRKCRFLSQAYTQDELYHAKYASVDLFLYTRCFGSETVRTDWSPRLILHKHYTPCAVLSRNFLAEIPTNRTFENDIVLIVNIGYASCKLRESSSRPWDGRRSYALNVHSPVFHDLGFHEFRDVSMDLGQFRLPRRWLLALLFSMFRWISNFGQSRTSCTRCRSLKADWIIRLTTAFQLSSFSRYDEKREFFFLTRNHFAYSTCKYPTSYANGVWVSGRRRLTRCRRHGRFFDWEKAAAVTPVGVTVLEGTATEWTSFPCSLQFLASQRPERCVEIKRGREGFLVTICWTWLDLVSCF